MCVLFSYFSSRLSYNLISLRGASSIFHGIHSGMKKIKIKKRTRRVLRNECKRPRAEFLKFRESGKADLEITGDHLPSINHELPANFDPTTVSRVAESIPKRIPSSTSSIFSRRVVVVVVVIVVIVVAEVMAVDL